MTEYYAFNFERIWDFVSDWLLFNHSNRSINLKLRKMVNHWHNYEVYTNLNRKKKTILVSPKTLFEW